MTDERVIRLLEEIRDLQRQHIERYGEALRNQEESIRLQQAGLRRVRVILGFAAAALALAVGILVLLIVRVLARLPWARAGTRRRVPPDPRMQPAGPVGRETSPGRQALERAVERRLSRARPRGPAADAQVVRLQVLLFRHR